MGRTFIKAVLNSARGIHPGDSSPAAQNARRISGFADLEGVEFLGKVDWDKDQNGQDKCVIKAAITPDHKDYAALMAGASTVPASTPTAPNAYAQATGRAPRAWALPHAGAINAAAALSLQALLTAAGGPDLQLRLGDPVGLGHEDDAARCTPPADTTLVLVLGAVTLTWIAAAVMTALDARHELDELLDGHLAQAAALLVVQQAQGEVDDDDRTLDAPSLHKYAPQVAFQVFHEGRLALRSANAPPLPMVEQNRHFRTGFKTVRIDGTAWRVFAAHGAERDVQVYVGEQLQSRAAIGQDVLRSTAHSAGWCATSCLRAACACAISALTCGSSARASANV